MQIVVLVTGTGENKGYQKAETSFDTLGNQNRKLKELGIGPVGEEQLLE